MDSQPTVSDSADASFLGSAIEDMAHVGLQGGAGPAGLPITLSPFPPPSLQPFERHHHPHQTVKTQLCPPPSTAVHHPCTPTPFLALYPEFPPHPTCLVSLGSPLGPGCLVSLLCCPAEASVGYAGWNFSAHEQMYGNGMVLPCPGSGPGPRACVGQMLRLPWVLH